MKSLKEIVLVIFFMCAFNIEAQIVYTTKSGKKYHKQNCRFLKYSQKKTTIAKSKALGFLACKICKPKVNNTSNITNSKSNNLIPKRKTRKKKHSQKINASQCIGKTKSGRRCRRKTKNINRRCYQH